MLIVCEGKKTEPYYLISLCKDLLLDVNRVQIQSCPTGNDAVSIVKYVLKQLKGNKDEYNRGYCVFDKEHTNYNIALEIVAANQANGIPIYAITSVPCFEYWLLLHFINSSSPYMQKGSKSPGDQLKSEIKCYIKNYGVSYQHTFSETKQYLFIAIKRSKEISEQQKTIGNDNPSTNMHELIEYLIEIAK